MPRIFGNTVANGTKLRRLSEKKIQLIHKKHTNMNNAARRTGGSPSGLAATARLAAFISCFCLSCFLLVMRELVRGGEAAALVIDKLTPNCHLLLI